MMQASVSQGPENGGVLGEECHFESWDGCPIYYRHWQCHPGMDRTAVVLLHDHQEHSDYYQSLASSIAAEDCCVFAWDARGCGRSPAADSEENHFHTLVRDLDRFIGHLCQRWQLAPSNIAVVGHGMGAALAATWIHDYAPELASAVLSSLPIRLRAFGPLRLRGLEIMQRLQPDLEVRTYLKVGQITTDRAEAALRRDDPFVSPQLPSQLLITQQEAMRRIAFRPESIDVPVLMLSAGKDRIIDTQRSRAFFDRIGSFNKTWQEFSDSGNALFHDTERRKSIALVRDFLVQTFEDQNNRPKVYIGNTFRRGPQLATARETEGAPHWPGLSRGARLARETGFYSGHHLDYLLRNRASGRSLLERRVDGRHLDQMLCRALRSRYDQMAELIRNALPRNGAGYRRPRIVQLGGAPARCLRETLAGPTPVEVDALCIDSEPTEIESGRRRCEAEGLTSLAYQVGNPSDTEVINSLAPNQHLVIADGIIESCLEPGVAMRLLRAINGRLASDGLLILGNVLPHPSLHGALPDAATEWQPRGAADLNRMLRLVGFEPVRTEVEDNGVYALILARKRRSRAVRAVH